MVEQSMARLAAGGMTRPAGQQSAWAKLGRSLRANRAGLLGLLCLTAILLAAACAPWLAPHDPTEQDLRLRLLPPAWTAEGNSAYWLGTDHLGRDILSRVLFGARVSIIVGFTSVALSLLIGAVLGLIAGYRGGWLDDLIGRVIDIQLAIPYMLLAVALVMVLGSSLPNLILVLVLYGWTVYARLVRGQTLSVREREYVLAGQTVGVPTGRLLARHVLPNISSPILVMATLEIANMIIFEAGLSFLGLGVQPPTPSWGGMLADGRDYIPAGIWWPATFPGIAISLTVLSLNLVGDWLRDWLDPRLSQ
jgi:peptide/nickel transport system permease protein